MDAFYASVEQRDAPELRGRPLIVGGHARRGVVLAASYEVRPYGVRSAMPMARALRLAPDAVVVPPRFDAYAEASERIHAIFESVTPLIEPLSLDEAFLDVTGSIGLFGPPSAIATHLRARIANELGLPASAGISSIKFMAKIASDLAKPNGQIEVPAERVESFLAPLPVSRLWGVGPKTEGLMNSLELRTIGDVAARDPAWLEQHLGKSGQHYWALSHGIDDRSVVPDRQAKSIGAEDTFEHDVADVAALSAHIHSQALRVGRRLRKAGLAARVVVVKLKYSNFKVITRRTTLKEPTDDGMQLYVAAKDLLAAASHDHKVRLTGVAAHGLVSRGEQLGLLEKRADNTDRARRLNSALDHIASRFGSSAVLPADVAQSDGQSNDRLDEARRLAGAARFDVPSRERR